MSIAIALSKLKPIADGGHSRSAPEPAFAVAAAYSDQRASGIRLLSTNVSISYGFGWRRHPIQLPTIFAPY